MIENINIESNQIINYIEKEYQLIIELCKIDKLKKAWGNLILLEKFIQDNLSTHSNNIHFDKLVKEIQDSKRLNRLKVEYEEISELMAMMDEDSKSFGWNEISSSHGINCLYKENGSGMHSIRMDGIIESPIFDVCSVIMEVNLYSTWIPKLKEAELLGQDSRFKKLLYARASAPWPVSDRDVVLWGYGVDMLEEEDKILVIARSPKEGDFETLPGGVYKKPKEPKHDVVRVETRMSGFILKPLDEGRTFVQVVSLTDPRMSLMPYWLLNFVTNQFCHFLFVMLRKQSKSVQSSKEYQKAIKENPIYDELKQKITSLLK